MEPPIDPNDRTVSELRDALEEVEDPDAVEAILEAEEAGKNRSTAREAIQERIEELDRELVTASDDVESLALAEGEEVLTVAGPEESRELSERLLGNLEGIRTTLEDARQSGGRHEARLRQLENQVNDLAAYTGALEEFLDDEGTAQQVIESVQNDLDSISDDVDDIKPVIRSHARSLQDQQSRLLELEDNLAEHESALGSVEGDLESLTEDFESLRETANTAHDEHSDRLDTLEDALEGHSGDLQRLEDELETVAESVREVETELGDLDEKVQEGFAEAADERAEIRDETVSNAEAIDEQADRLDQIADNVATLQEMVGEAGAVDQRFDEIEDQLSALEDWRDQVRSVMAGAVGADTSEPDSNG